MITITGILSNLLPVGVFTNTATITGSTLDSSAHNNTAGDGGVYIIHTNLAITKTVNNNTPGPGKTITYTIIVANNGPDAVEGVIVSDTLPVSVTHIDDTSTGGGSYDQASGVWSNFSGSLASGNSYVLTITAVVTDVAGTLGQQIVNTAVISDFKAVNLNSSDDTSGVTMTVKGADLNVSKSVDNNNPSADGTIVYTVVITNLGPDDTTGVVVSDTLPISLTFVSSNTTRGSYASPTWNIGSLDNGQKATLKITATVKSNMAGQTITNVAGVNASDLADLVPGNNTATATLTVKDADLSLGKMVTPTNPKEGDVVTYTVVITNQGPDGTGSVVVSDTLPGEVIFGGYSTSNGSTYSASPVGVWNVGSLANQAVATLTITATVKSDTAGQTITNTASISSSAEGDSDSSDDTAQAACTVQNADLQLAKLVYGLGGSAPGSSTAVVDAGGIITYTVIISNPTGPDDVLPGTVVSDTLPAGVVLQGAQASGGSPSLPGGNLVRWTAPQLNVGDIHTLTITATVNSGTAAQSFANQAQIESAPQGDLVTVNNTAVATITVTGADLEVGKMVDNTNPHEGQQVVYTVTITNHGPNATGGVVISDTVPLGLTPVISSTSQGSYDGRVWSLSVPALPATGTTAATLTITATVQSGYGGQTIVNTAIISAATVEDSITANNVGTATLTVRPSANLAISKTASSIAVPGTMITYTIIVSNSGPQAAAGVVVSDIFPTEFSGSSWSCTPSNGATCTASGSGNINDTITLPQDGQVLYTINGTVVSSATGSITNTAGVIAPMIFDSDPTNNTISATTVLSPSAHLIINKSSRRDNDALPNAVVTFTVTVNNAGPSDANNTVVSDTVPIPGLVGNDWTWSCTAAGGAQCPNAGPANGSINQTILDLPAGGQVIYTIVGSLVTSQTVVTNVAEVTAPAGLLNLNAANSTASIVSAPAGPLYLPVIFKDTTGLILPDLVIDSLVATNNQVQVVIRNQGLAPVPDNEVYEFWVDLYINPGRKPGYNETWQTMGCQGAVWGITWSGSPYSPTDPARRALPLEPGEVFTLTTRGDYYWWAKEGIIWPLPSGATVYAQVDSANAATTYGAVMESNEGNNVSGQFAVQSVGVGSSAKVADGGLEKDVSKTSLPPRP